MGQRVEADATEYSGTIRTDEPFGTVVFPLRYVIDRNGFPNNDIIAIIVTLSGSGLVQGIFRLSGGTTDRQLSIIGEGGIDAVNASGVFPEVRLYNNRYALYEDSIIYQEAPPSTLGLPTTLEINLNIIVVGMGNDAESLTRIGRVSLTTPPGKL